MVNVTHNDNNGVSGLKVCIIVLCGVDDSVFDCNDDFLCDLCAELACYDFCGVVVENVVDCCHLAECKELLDYLCGSHLQLHCKVADRDFVGNRD